MSGIYLHIPFCRKACHYCDFHFSTNLKLKEDMIHAIAKEVHLKSEKISKTINTIYLGGGTPSLLTKAELSILFDSIYQHFAVEEKAEITLEANPEDVDKSNLKMWKGLGINRLSMGIQSFDDQTLAYVNRAHDAGTGRKALSLALSSGFDNITADLIFGIPPFDLTQWEKELDEMLGFNLPHLSVYGLTIEPNTVFGKWYERKRLDSTPEENMEGAFRMAHSKLKEQGYNHYEISNYALPGQESRHNTSYWQGASYYGFGPGAHSFDGMSRSFNISNNPKYIKSISEGNIPETVEHLNSPELINEFLYTRLRMAAGLNLIELKDRFQYDLFDNHRELINQYQSKSLMVITDHQMQLTLDGMLLADEICMNFFCE